MEKQYKIGEFAKLINTSTRNLQRWDKDGTLVAYRNPKNRRYYTHTQYLEYIGVKSVDSKRKTVIYARVSNRSQKDDLNNQVEFLKTYANAKGIIVSDIMTDIGSGLNYKRKKWNELLDLVQSNEIDSILIAHKDRFIRFGYEWFENFLEKQGVSLIVVNNEKLSPQEELVQDLISIIHVFSCRIYELRKYKKKITDDLKK